MSINGHRSQSVNAPYGEKSLRFYQKKARTPKHANRVIEVKTMQNATPKWTMRDRVTAILESRKPDRLPFIDRMEIWYQSKCQDGSLPGRFNGMSLNEIHEDVGIGRQNFLQGNLSAELLNRIRHRLHDVARLARCGLRLKSQASR